MKDPVLEVFLGFVGVAIVVLNASLWMAWIVIGKHSKLLGQHVRRIADLERLEMRRSRRDYNINEDLWSDEVEK